MDRLTTMIEKAQADPRFVVDVNLVEADGSRARLILRPTRGNKIIEGVLTADTRAKLDHVRTLLNM